ncbi:unnamed protein product [Ixodes pacificus]
MTQLACLKNIKQCLLFIDPSSRSQLEKNNFLRINTFMG